MKEETQTGECKGIESPRRDLYTLYSRNSSRISKISSRTVCKSARESREKRKERQHNAREDGETLSPLPHSSLSPSPCPYIPFADASSEATEILEALFVSGFSSV